MRPKAAQAWLPAGDVRRGADRAEYGPALEAAADKAREHEKQVAQELGQWDSDQGPADDGSFSLMDIAVLLRVASSRVRNGGANEDGGSRILETTALPAR